MCAFTFTYCDRGTCRCTHCSFAALLYTSVDRKQPYNLTDAHIFVFNQEKKRNRNTSWETERSIESDQNVHIENFPAQKLQDWKVMWYCCSRRKLITKIKEKERSTPARNLNIDQLSIRTRSWLPKWITLLWWYI